MQPLTVSGVVFNAPLKYSAGHTISADEAAVLNGLFHSDLSSKLKPLVVKAQKAAGALDIPPDAKEDLDAKLAEFARTHTFVPKSANSFDPVTREAFKMIRPQFVNALKAKGLDPKTLAPGKLEAIMLQWLSKHPETMAEAKRRIEAITSVADDIISSA